MSSCIVNVCIVCKTGFGIACRIWLLHSFVYYPGPLLAKTEVLLLESKFWSQDLVKPYLMNWLANQAKIPRLQVQGSAEKHSIAKFSFNLFEWITMTDALAFCLSKVNYDVLDRDFVFS